MKLLKAFPAYTKKSLLLPDPQGGEPHPDIKLPGVCIGIEIESELWPIAQYTEALDMYWDVEGDGSLRGDSAAEAISSPLLGANIIRALTLYEKLASEHPDHFSYRCSTHLHMNMLELPLDQIASLMLITLAADNYLFAAGDEGRRTNYNCRPVSLLTQEVEGLAWAAQGLMEEKVEGLQHHLDQDFRYIGTNWSSILQHGTVEFRHFPGEYRAARIIKWVRRIHHMYDAAQAASLDHVYALISEGEDKFLSLVGMEDLLYEGHENDWWEARASADLFMQVFNNNFTRGSFDQILRDNYLVR